MSDNKEIKEVSSFPVSLIFALILSVAIVMFAIQNSQSISLKALTWSTEIPLALLLFITLGIGVIITVLYSIPGWNRRRRMKKQLKKRIGLLEKEVASLKEKASIKGIEEDSNLA
ncbi:MAG: LapA family protein [Bacteroidia bacterium]|nr:LapA family protein [Bacteroidia bacterium]